MRACFGRALAAIVAVAPFISIWAGFALFAAVVLGFGGLR